MPRSAASRCTRRCGKLATQDGRCEDHQRKPWENPSTRNAILDPWKWKKAKDNHRQHEPGCRVCGRTDQVEVDHITEVTDGGEPYDDSNLQTLCTEHHKQKTALHRRLRAARKQLQQGEGAS